MNQDYESTEIGLGEYTLQSWILPNLSPEQRSAVESGKITLEEIVKQDIALVAKAKEIKSSYNPKNRDV